MWVPSSRASTDIHGGCCELSPFRVYERYRRQGLGAVLRRSGEAEAVARGCAQVVLAIHNFQAPDFYERMGYERLTRSKADRRATPALSTSTSFGLTRLRPHASANAPGNPLLSPFFCLHSFGSWSGNAPSTPGDHRDATRSRAETLLVRWVKPFGVEQSRRSLPISSYLSRPYTESDPGESAQRRRRYRVPKTRSTEDTDTGETSRA